jgi:hypothetical protein
VDKRIRTPDKFNYTEWGAPYYGYYQYCVENLKTAVNIKERYYNIVSGVEETFNSGVMSSWRELNNIYLECLLDKFVQVEYLNGVLSINRIKLKSRIKGSDGAFFVCPVVAVSITEYTLGYCVYWVAGEDACLLFRSIQSVKKKVDISAASASYNSLMKAVMAGMKPLEKYSKVMYGFQETYPAMYKPLLSYTRIALYKALGSSKAVNDGSIKALVNNMLKILASK